MDLTQLFSRRDNKRSREESQPHRDKAAFIISIDTELLWGYVLHPNHKMERLLKQAERAGRGPIDSLLALFEKYHITATWAIVGHLFLDQCEKEGGLPHKDMPRFRNNWYSWDPCSNIQQSPLYYGKDIVEAIRFSKVEHEIGYHSFSHCYFSECSREVAEAEICKGEELAKQLGITLRSFVFPANKIGHIELLKRHEFRIYRGPVVWGKGTGGTKEGFLLRAANLVRRRTMAQPVEPIWRDGIWEIPGSMHFCATRFSLDLALRAKRGIQAAIRNRKIFHMHMHPEDFLAAPDLLSRLEQVLEFVSARTAEGELQVITMGELSSLLDQRKLTLGGRRR